MGSIHHKTILMGHHERRAQPTDELRRIRNTGIDATRYAEPLVRGDKPVGFVAESTAGSIAGSVSVDSSVWE